MALSFSTTYIKREVILDCKEKEGKLSYLEMRFVKCNSHRSGIENNEPFTKANVKDRKGYFYTVFYQCKYPELRSLISLIGLSPDFLRLS